MDPYCACPAVTDKHPYGLALYRGTPSECLKDGVYTQYQKDTRANEKCEPGTHWWEGKLAIVDICIRCGAQKNIINGKVGYT